WLRAVCIAILRRKSGGVGLLDFSFIGYSGRKRLCERERYANDSRANYAAAVPESASLAAGTACPSLHRVCGGSHSARDSPTAGAAARIRVRMLACARPAAVDERMQRRNRNGDALRLRDTCRKLSTDDYGFIWSDSAFHTRDFAGEVNGSVSKRP